MKQDKSKKSLDVMIRMPYELARDLVWLSSQKDSKGEMRSISEIVCSALILMFSTINMKNEIEKDN